MSDKCPYCGFNDDPWFKFVDLSICQKPDMSGARFEIRVRCNECERYIDWPGEDFPGKTVEPSHIRQPADKRGITGTLIYKMFDRHALLDEIKTSMGCSTEKDNCPLCEDR